MRDFRASLLTLSPSKAHTYFRYSIRIAPMEVSIWAYKIYSDREVFVYDAVHRLGISPNVMKSFFERPRPEQKELLANLKISQESIDYFGWVDGDSHE